ncbi:MAG: hypothetical protein V3U24_08820 [Candidatus Neomarinimicrobiota bacterium]
MGKAKRMKQIPLAILTLFIVAVAASPNDLNVSKLDFDQIEEAYVISLNNENLGVIESALYCVVMLQSVAPERSFSRLNEAVTALSTAGTSPQIRYKASIAGLYLDNPELTEQLNKQSFHDEPDFWAMLVKNTLPLLTDS